MRLFGRVIVKFLTVISRPLQDVHHGREPGLERGRTYRGIPHAGRIFTAALCLFATACNRDGREGSKTDFSAGRVRKLPYEANSIDAYLCALCRSRSAWGTLSDLPRVC